MATAAAMERRAPAYQKADLIQGALQTLRAAQGLDERNDLDATSLVEWYERTIPDVTDIKVIAGAMEVELLTRQGERLAQEGERRGRPEKGSHCDPFSEPDKMRRKRARTVASQPKAVNDYVQRAVKAKRVPTVRGAVRAAKLARAATTTAQPAVAVATAYADRVRTEVRGRIECVRGQTLTLEALASRWRVHTDIARRYVREAALLGDVVTDGKTYMITTTREMEELETFKKTMHAEIVEKRKEARDGYHKWRPDNVHTLRLSTLLDWIEDQVRSTVLKARMGAKA